LHDVKSGIGQKLIPFAQMHDTFEVVIKYDDRETYIIPGKMGTNQMHQC